MLCARETTLTFFIMYLSSLMSEVYLLVKLFFKNYVLPLFLSGLLSYLVGMKRRTSRHVPCKRDNSHFLCYVLIPLMSEVYLLVNLLSKLYVTFILQWIAFVFGRDEEEDQLGCHMQETQLSLSLLCTYLP